MIRDNGIKTNLVDKAGHNWSLEGYTRTVIRTTTARTYNDLRIQSMKDFDSVLATMPVIQHQDLHALLFKIGRAHV